MARSKARQGQTQGSGQYSGPNFSGGGGGDSFSMQIPPHIGIPQDYLNEFTMWLGTVPYVYKLQRQTSGQQNQQTQPTSQNQQNQQTQLSGTTISAKQVRALSGQITQTILQSLAGATALPGQAKQAKGTSYKGQNQQNRSRGKQLVNV